MTQVFAGLIGDRLGKCQAVAFDLRALLPAGAAVRGSAVGAAARARPLHLRARRRHHRAARHGLCRRCGALRAAADGAGAFSRRADVRHDRRPSRGRHHRRPFRLAHGLRRAGRCVRICRARAGHASCAAIPGPSRRITSGVARRFYRRLPQSVRRAMGALRSGGGVHRGRHLFRRPDLCRRRPARAFRLEFFRRRSGHRSLRRRLLALCRKVQRLVARHRRARTGDRRRHRRA